MKNKNIIAAVSIIFLLGILFCIDWKKFILLNPIIILVFIGLFITYIFALKKLLS